MSQFKNASLVDFALEDIIRVDYYRFKLLKTLSKLVDEEYRLENYGLSHQYALTYLKLYKRVVRDYAGDIRLNTKTNNSKIVQTDNDMKSIKYISPKYLDRVINTMMDCRKYLVNLSSKKIIDEINQYLPHHEQWEVFTKFIDIYHADNNTWGESNLKIELVEKYNKYTNKLLCQYQLLKQMKTFNNYQKFLL